MRDQDRRIAQQTPQDIQQMRGAQTKTKSSAYADHPTQKKDTKCFSAHNGTFTPQQRARIRTLAQLSSRVTARGAFALLNVEGTTAAASANHVRLVVAHAKALCALALHATTSKPNP
jgi:hypothetical protein